MQREYKAFIRRAAYVMSALALCACGSNAHDELAHHDHSHQHASSEHDHEGPAHEGHEGHDHGSGTEIILEPAQAKAFGVIVDTVTLGKFNDVVKVSGQIIDSPDAQGVVVAPASGVVTFSHIAMAGTHVAAGTRIATITPNRVTGGDPNVAARAAIKAAQTEVDRLKPLRERGIVSVAEYNRAIAQLEAAKAAYSPVAASGAALAPVSGTLTTLLVAQGQYVEAGTPIATISGAGKLTLRADLQQKHFAQASSFNGARIRTPYSDETIDIAAYGGTRSNSGQAVSSSAGYIPIYFNLKNDGSLIPGSYVEVYLLGAERDNVISVPLSAISEQQGNYFVYVRVDEEGYLKSPVRLGARDGKRVEILSGLHDGDIVVTQGTTTVRLAETSNVVPEGHTHNH